jgi:hypothetical protein
MQCFRSLFVRGSAVVQRLNVYAFTAMAGTSARPLFTVGNASLQVGSVNSAFKTAILAKPPSRENGGEGKVRTFSVHAEMTQLFI